MFLDHTQRRTTVGKTPLDEWSARPRDLYITTNDIRNRQLSMPVVGFEPKISADERFNSRCKLNCGTINPVKFRCPFVTYIFSCFLKTVQHTKLWYFLVICMGFNRVFQIFNWEIRYDFVCKYNIEQFISPEFIKYTKYTNQYMNI